MSTSGSGKDDLIDRLAEEFAARYRRGERPALTEYIARYPELARDIRELFPALAEMEQAEEDRRDPLAWGGAGVAAPLEQIGGYRIIGEIGRGGMGVVYEAEQVALGRRVALKLLSLSGSRDGQAARRFRREARAAAQLHHSNIVPVFEVGQEGDTCYYAMQLIPGKGLDIVVEELRKLRSGAPQGDRPAQALAQSLWTGRFAGFDLVATSQTEAEFSPGAEGKGRPAAQAELKRVAKSSDATSSAVLPGDMGLSAAGSDHRHYFVSVGRIGQQVATALGYAHARGIIHRDIKPSNLLLDAAGVVWVTDFGLAKTDEDALTRTGDLLGTFRYMAPERFRGVCDTRADVYSLGLTLYEMLTLRPAFDSADRLRLIDQVKNEEPARPRSVDPRIPRDLETVVLKAMDKDPDQRYSSAELMAEDLRRFLADEPILARRTAVRERAWRWCRRNPALASLTGLVFVSLVVAAVTASVGYWQTTWALDKEARAHQEADVQTEVARREADRSRAMRYLTDMQLAAELWQNDDGTARTVGDLLAAHIPQDGETDLREFTWRYQWNLIHNQPTLLGHESPVALGAFTSDGRLITVDDAHQLRVWDTMTRQAVRSSDLTEIPGVWRVDLASDGKLLAVGTTQGTVHLLDPATGTEQRMVRVSADGPVRVRFVGNSETLLTVASDDTAKFWHSSTGEEKATVYRPDEDYLSDLALSPDGSLWVTRNDTPRNNLILYDSSRKDTVRTTLKGPGDTAITFAFSPKGGIAAEGTFGGQLLFWDLNRAEVIDRQPQAHAGAVSRLAFSADGRILASGGQDGLVEMWQAPTPRRPRRYKGHTDAITMLAFSPDGRTLASGSADGTIKLWDTANPQEGRQLGATGMLPFALAYSPDGRWMAASRQTSTSGVLLDSRTGQVVRSFGEARQTGPGSPFALRVAFAPDGRTLATGDSDSYVRLWDVESGHLLHALEGKPTGLPKPEFARIASVAFSADGALIAAGFGMPADHDVNYSQIVRVWDARTGKELATLAGHRNTIPSLVFSPDGRHLATACHDRAVRVWEVGTWQNVRTWTGPSMFKSVAYSPDGQILVAGCADGTIRQWETSTGRELTPMTGHTGRVMAVAFLPGGHLLASGASDKTLRLWDIRSGRNVRILKGPTNVPPESVVFAPDGNTLATIWGGGGLRVWEAASPETVAAALADERARHAAERARNALFVQNWLTVSSAPLAAGQSALDGLHVELLPDEAHLHPRPGDALHLGDKNFEWQESMDADPVWGRFFEAKVATAHRVSYGVSYLRCETALPDVRLTLPGKDTLAKVYLNGQSVLVTASERDGKASAVVALAPGTNVLLLKIVNRRRMWRHCLELTDKDGHALPGVQARASP